MSQHSSLSPARWGGSWSSLRGWLWQIAGVLLVGAGLAMLGVARYADWWDARGLIARVLVGLVGAATGYGGARAYNLGRKIRIIPASVALAEDSRPPILYLRSFQDDEAAAETRNYGNGVLSLATEEEQLAHVLKDLGPVVAVGRPGEELPELGAARLYFENAEWQERVLELMKRARLVVLRAGSTPGFLWELEQAVRLVPPEHLLLLLPFEGAEYATFADRVRSMIPGPLPSASVVRKKASWLDPTSEHPLSGFLCFDREWNATFLPLTRRWTSTTIAWTRFLVPFFRETLQPVFERLKQEPPPEGRGAVP